jgi:hypothetical protein
VNRDNVRVLEHRRRGGFAAKALDKLLGRELAGENHLHRHDAVQTGLPRTIDNAHAAAGDFFQQFVIPELPFRERRRGLDRLRRPGNCLRFGRKAEDAIRTRIRGCVRR